MRPGALVYRRQLSLFHQFAQNRRLALGKPGGLGAETVVHVQMQHRQIVRIEGNIPVPFNGGQSLRVMQKRHLIQVWTESQTENVKQPEKGDRREQRMGCEGEKLEKRTFGSGHGKHPRRDRLGL